MVPVGRLIHESSRVPVAGARRAGRRDAATGAVMARWRLPAATQDPTGLSRAALPPVGGDASLPFGENESEA